MVYDVTILDEYYKNVWGVVVQRIEPLLQGLFVLPAAPVKIFNNWRSRQLFFNYFVV